MTATFRDYSYGTVDRASGRSESWGSRTDPIKETSITGDQIDADKLLYVPAGSTVTLWEWALTEQTFSFMRIVIDGGSGFLDVYWEGDKPTNLAGGDLSPSGNAKCWNQMGLSCQSDWKLTTPSIQVNPTLVAAAGGAGKDSAGTPAIIAHVDTVEGRVYKVQVRNRGTSAVPILFTKVD